MKDLIGEPNRPDSFEPSPLELRRMAAIIGNMLIETHMLLQRFRECDGVFLDRECQPIRDLVEAIGVEVDWVSPGMIRRSDD